MDSNSMLDFVQKAAEKQANAEGAAYASTLSVSLEHEGLSLLSWTSLKGLCQENTNEDLKRLQKTLYIVEYCLRNPTLVNGDEHVLPWFYSWIPRILLPPSDLIAPPEYPELETPKVPSLDIRRFYSISFLGLRILRHLDSLLPLEEVEDHAVVVKSLAIYTDEQDLWTTEASARESQAVLSKHSQLARKSSVLIDYILRNVIIPLFAKSQNPAVTSQGRRAIAPMPVGHDYEISDRDTKPWKYDKVYIVAVFRWVLQNLDGRLVEENWPLLIPPLLALIDDHTTNVKAKGCELLILLLRNTTPALLTRTGLGDVFQDAVMPCLLSLPSLTPTEESIKLLSQAYPALIALGRVRFASEADHRAKIQFLDNIMRRGILSGYAHCNENVHIGRLLVDEMGLVVEEMGISSTKHLKYTVPLLSDVLAAPFGTTFPPLLIAAWRAMQTVIRNGWPRIALYRAEILRGLVLCWRRVDEEVTNKHQMAKIRHNLKDIMKLLGAALQNELDLASDLDILKNDDRLTELLAVD